MFMKLIPFCFVGAGSPPNDWALPWSSAVKMTAGSSDIPSVNPSLCQTWDTERYQSQHSFVWEYGSCMVDILKVRAGERILDLGCGTGELTQEIASRGATVVGMDSDTNMIRRAQAQFPDLLFKLGDARSFELAEPVDAVFSNAALHWVKEAEQAVESIANALKPGGRFVTEFGGKGNIREIESYLLPASRLEESPYYFPSIAEYSSLLERRGLEVTNAELFDRPTTLAEGENGLRSWLLMFGDIFLSGLAEEAKEAVISGAEQELRPKLYNGKQWVADYRRIRIVARKVDPL